MKRLYYDQDGNPFQIKKGERITVTEMSCEQDFIVEIEMTTSKKARVMNAYKVSDMQRFTPTYPETLRAMIRHTTYRRKGQIATRINKIILLPCGIGNDGIELEITNNRYYQKITE